MNVHLDARQEMERVSDDMLAWVYGMVGIVEDSCKRAIDQSSPQEVRDDTLASPLARVVR